MYNYLSELKRIKAGNCERDEDSLQFERNFRFSNYVNSSCYVTEATKKNNFKKFFLHF
jgi:hypothetical protein